MMGKMIRPWYERLAILAAIFLSIGIILTALEADCADCGIAPCQTTDQCFAGCACTIGRGQVFGRCVSVYP